MEITARQAAIANGEKKYIGKPCRYGHAGLRWVQSCACVECEAIAVKEWQQSERGREYYRRYKRRG